MPNDDEKSQEYRPWYIFHSNFESIINKISSLKNVQKSVHNTYQNCQSNINYLKNENSFNKQSNVVSFSSTLSSHNNKENVSLEINKNFDENKLNNIIKSSQNIFSSSSSFICSEKEVLKLHGFKNFEILVSTTEFESYLNTINNQSQNIQKIFTDSITSSNNLLKNQTDFYEVEKILGTRKDKLRKTEYLIKWKNYSYQECTWEKDVDECMELLNEFKKRKRILHIIANQLKNNRKYLYHLRHESPSFFVIQKWEDDLCEKSLSCGYSPIYVENWAKIIVKLKKFTFITKNQITIEAKKLFKEPEKLLYCKCTSKNCGSCKNCCPDIFGMKFPYTTSGRVKKTFNLINEWLIECADSCNCGLDCVTRVVQRGRQIPILIFRTIDRGWSVRTMVNILANTFVMEYVGVVITLEKAKKSSPTYQFEMDACIDSAFVVDALTHGNEARFVNHSCNPNMVVRGVFSDRFDKRYHRIAYFSSRVIEKGEELTINYFSKLNDDEYKRITKKRSYKSCFCNSSNCRGFIV